MAAPVVLITGCSTGIGRELAIRLSQAGYAVVATARRMEAIAGLPTAGKAVLDVEQTASVEAAVQAVMAQFGRIDFLINNAGYGQIGTVEEVTEEQFAKVFEVNVHGPGRMIRAVLPIMRRQGSGRIINLSSVAGLCSIPAMGVYCATKYAVEALTDALRVEVAPFGIQAVLVEPGIIATEFEKTARKEAESQFGLTDSPYRRLYERFVAVVERLSIGAPGPEVVAQVIRRAMEAPRPKARYQVPPAISLAAFFLKLSGAGMRDWFMRTALGWRRQHP